MDLFTNSYLKNIKYSFYCTYLPIHLNRMSIHIDSVQRQKFYPKFSAYQFQKDLH